MVTVARAFEIDRLYGLFAGFESNHPCADDALALMTKLTAAESGILGYGNHIRIDIGAGLEFEQMHTALQVEGDGKLVVLERYFEFRLWFQKLHAQIAKSKITLMFKRRW
jgi:hypothetical protein